MAQVGKKVEKRLKLLYLSSTFWIATKPFTWYNHNLILCISVLVKIIKRVVLIFQNRVFSHIIKEHSVIHTEVNGDIGKHFKAPKISIFNLNFPMFEACWRSWWSFAESLSFLTFFLILGFSSVHLSRNWNLLENVHQKLRNSLDRDRRKTKGC